ncbi:MAG: G5 domain-containing protein [Clostridia bacterium]|nr:G5 domain-containing protein [Clostridia bacterium]
MTLTKKSVKIKKRSRLFRFLCYVFALVLLASASVTIFAIGPLSENEKAKTDSLILSSVKSKSPVSKSYDTVWYKYRNKKLPVKFKTVYEETDELEIGKKEIDIQGKNGTKLVVYKDKYINGELSGSKIVKEIIIAKPVNKVIKVGTKRVDSLSSYENTNVAISELDMPKSIKLDKNGIPLNYDRCIKGKATAYTGDTITSTGKTPIPGYIAVDPKEIPYGSELYVVSSDGKYVYGYSIAEDTGGFVQMQNTDIDLFMNNDEMCEEWGNRSVNIYVLS